VIPELIIFVSRGITVPLCIYIYIHIYTYIYICIYIFIMSFTVTFRFSGFQLLVVIFLKEFFFSPLWLVPTKSNECAWQACCLPPPSCNCGDESQFCYALLITRPFSSEALAPSQVNSRGVCDEICGHKMRSTPSTSVSPRQYHSTTATYSSSSTR